MTTVAWARVLLGVGCVMWVGGHPPAVLSSHASAMALGREDVAVTVHIEHRRFVPHVVHLRVGRQVRLIFKNHDAELHAFVPVDLLTGTHVQVAGNGAPQFGKDGLRRVLIPTQGRTELVFVAKEAGAFPFFCDLPGHIMNGTIVVSDDRRVLE